MIYIGIGATESQRIPFEVLKYSIDVNTTLHESQYRVLNLGNLSYDIEIFPSEEVFNSYTIKSGQQHTPFSFQRFLFALYFSKSASSNDLFLYLDSDMLVLADIQTLKQELSIDESIKTASTHPFWGRRSQNSVCLFNDIGLMSVSSDFCEFLMGELKYEDVFYKKYNVNLLSSDWNSLEHMNATTNLIHYTDMDSQPWLRGGNANAGIWYHYLKSWTKICEDNKTLLFKQCEGKILRPGLKEIVTSDVNWPCESALAIFRDFFYVPPHRLPGIRNLLPNFIVAFIYRIKMMSKNNRPNSV